MPGEVVTDVGRGHVSTAAAGKTLDDGDGHYVECGADVMSTAGLRMPEIPGRGGGGAGPGVRVLRTAYCSYCRGRSGHGHTLCAIVARVHGGWVGGGRLGKRLFGDWGMANSDPEYARP